MRQAAVVRPGASAAVTRPVRKHGKASASKARTDTTIVEFFGPNSSVSSGGSFSMILVTSSLGLQRAYFFPEPPTRHLLAGLRAVSGTAQIIRS